MWMHLSALPNRFRQSLRSMRFVSDGDVTTQISASSTFAWSTICCVAASTVPTSIPDTAYILMCISVRPTVHHLNGYTTRSTNTSRLMIACGIMSCVASTHASSQSRAVSAGVVAPSSTTVVATIVVIGVAIPQFAAKVAVWQVWAQFISRNELILQFGFKLWEEVLRHS